jgi:probable O-glycosylation ligase (exosortase A-associated)
LAIAATGAVLWLKSGRKLIIGSVFGLIVVALVSFLPLAWFTRMDTIGQYQQDYSVVGRFEAWGHAINVAMARPLTGGGMGTFTAAVFAQYSPGVEWRAPHSIYFQALGEQGFIGLLLFAAIWLYAFADCRWVMKRTRDLPELKWAYDLASMVQLSMIAYATGGAFLSLVYLDFYYMLVAVAVAVRSVVAAELVPAPDRSAAVPRVRVARVPAASPVLGRPRSPP